MHIDIPFTFEALVRQPGGKRPIMATVRDRLAVDIVEMEGGAAPVVARYLATVGRTGGARSDIALRIVDGALLAPVHFLEGDEVSSMTTATCRERADDSAFMASTAWVALQHMAAAFAVDGVEQHLVVRSHRPVAVESVLRHAARSRFVDGVLHVPASEPVYHADGLGRIRSAALDAVRGKVPPARIWRATEEAVLLDYLARLSGDKANGEFDDNAISVHIPSWLSWDREMEMLKDLAARLVRSGHRRLTSLPLEAVVSWVGLRDCVQSNSDPRSLALAALQFSPHDPSSGSAVAAAQAVLDRDGVQCATDSPLAPIL